MAEKIGGKSSDHRRRQEQGQSTGGQMGWAIPLAEERTAYNLLLHP
jgi:hypothetical protein